MFPIREFHWLVYNSLRYQRVIDSTRDQYCVRDIDQSFEFPSGMDFVAVVVGLYFLIAIDTKLKGNSNKR